MADQPDASAADQPPGGGDEAAPKPEVQPVAFDTRDLMIFAGLTVFQVVLLLLTALYIFSYQADLLDIVRTATAGDSTSKWPFKDTSMELNGLECGMTEKLNKSQRTEKNAIELQFPWLYQLYSENKFVCSGVLITNQFIITVSSCMKTDSNSKLQKLEAKKTVYDLKDMKAIEATIGIKHALVPKDFNKDKPNVILLRLEKDVTIGPFSKPICLDTDAKLKDLFSEASLWFCSVGGYDESGKLTYMKSVDLMKDCKASQPPNEKSLRCAALDSCLKNAGAVLQCVPVSRRYKKDQTGMKWSLTGILRSTDCGATFTGTFLAMLHFRGWIYDVLTHRNSPDKYADLIT